MSRSHTARTVVIAAALVLLVSCEARSERYALTVSGVEFSVEVADDPETRERGLMGRTELGPKEGMLFVFESSEPRAFWMKDTLIPLSIAYVDANWLIREIHDMEPRSLEPVPSRAPARYALEVNRGAFERNGIAVGDRLVPSAELRDRLGR